MASAILLIYCIVLTHFSSLLKYALDLVDASSHDLPSYFPHDDDRGALRGVRDTESINASYDRYLRSSVL